MHLFGFLKKQYYVEEYERILVMVSN